MMVSPCICSRSFKKAWMNSKFEFDSNSDLTTMRREPRAASSSTLDSMSRTCKWQQTQSQDLSCIHMGHCSYCGQCIVKCRPVAHSWKTTSHNQEGGDVSREHDDAAIHGIPVSSLRNAMVTTAIGLCHSFFYDTIYISCGECANA